MNGLWRFYRNEAEMAIEVEVNTGFGWKRVTCERGGPAIKHSEIVDAGDSESAESLVKSVCEGASYIPLRS